MGEPESILATDAEALRRLAASAGGRRRLCEEALDAAHRSAGGTGAALYLSSEHGLRREAVAGEGSFPPFVEDDQLAALPHRELAGGALVLTPEADCEAVDAGADLLLSLLSYGLRLGGRVKEQRFAVNYRGVELEALYDVGLAIAGTLEIDELTEEVLLRAVSLLDARRGALFLLTGGDYMLQGTIGGSARQSVARDAEEVAAALAGQAADGDDVLLPGARYLLAVPIEVDGQPRGLLLVGDKESRTGVGPFKDSDRRTLLLFANQAGIAIENANLHRQALEKERLERELDLAADIQRRLLPDALPQLPGYQLAGWSRPARHVGGDYYSYLDLGSDHVGLVLGDVSGKGMPAALLVSTLHSTIQILSHQHAFDPTLMGHLNAHLCEVTASNQFVTLLLVDLDPASGRLRYLNGGHNPAVVLRRGSEVEQLAADGLPAGMMPAAGYALRGIQLDPGDLLCLYSDGITEAEAPDDREFGVEGLVATLQERRDEPLDRIVEALDEAVSAFTEGAPQGDDQTVVLLRRTG